MTYNLKDHQYACLEDDFLHIIFEFGKRDYWEGKDLCFDNNYALTLNDYKGQDVPFTVHNNCWTYSPEDKLKKLVGNTVEGDPFFFTCHDSGYKLMLRVDDLKESNL